jgi:hypothetical protein
MKLLSILVFLAAANVEASSHCKEATNLAKVMYAEAKGASLEGTLVVGECMLNRAENQNRSVCNTDGVKRATPPNTLFDYYVTLAKQLLKAERRPLSKGCDSWNAGVKPNHPGRITRHIDGQVFYVLKPMKE